MSLEDSGPFCGSHWSDPSCDEPCTCGHPCFRHYGAEECFEDGCACKAFEDVPDAPVPKPLTPDERIDADIAEAMRNANVLR